MLNPVPAFLALVWFAPVPPVKTPPKVPIGSPPQVCLAQVKGKGGPVDLRLFVTKMLPKQVVRVVVRDGKQVATPYTTYQAVVMERTVRVDGTSVLVTRKDGKVVALETVRKLLSRPTPVVYFGSGEPDPYYLTVVKDDVLIFSRKPAKPKR